MAVDEVAPVLMDGVLVHRFEGHEGPIYRPCTGLHCVYCADMPTARSYLSFWRHAPERRCRSQSADPPRPRR